MPRIFVENGLQKGLSYALVGEGVILVGRHERAQISIPDPMLSRRHCQIEYREGKIWIRDLGAMNGTYVNGVRVEHAQLEIGDRLQIGDTLLTLLGDQPGQGLAGHMVGGYRIIDRVGRGGMGTVWKALQLSLERTVALKLLSEDLSGDPAFVEAFIREARAAGELSHPNIVRVFDVGSDGDTHYFSMEYLEGGSVEGRIAREGRIRPAEALRIARDASRGLEYAETKGIVHRDIKPGNVLLTRDGVAKIGDLGIARRAPAGSLVSQDEGVCGSPHYMAPEQALGRPLDSRADLYALGVSIFQMLTGSTPFSGKTPREVILRRLREEPPSVRSRDPSIPIPVARLVSKLMAREPDARFAKAPELTAALDDLLRSGVESDRPRGSLRPRIRRIAVIVAILGAVAAGLGFAVHAALASIRERARIEADIRDRYADAEHRLQDGDPAAALAAVETLLARHPEAESVVPIADLVRQARAARERARAEATARLAEDRLALALALLRESEEKGREALAAVATEFPGTPAATRARDEVARLDRLAAESEALARQADVDFDRIRARVTPWLDTSNFRRAHAVWQEFPTRYAGTPAAAKVEAAREEIRALAADYASKAIVQSREVAETRGFAQARLVLERARDRLLEPAIDPGPIASIDREIAALADRERAQREKEAAEIEGQDAARLAEAVAAAATELASLRVDRARDELRAREILLQGPKAREALRERLRDLDAIGGFVAGALARAEKERPSADLPGLGRGTISGIRSRGIVFRRDEDGFPRPIDWKDLSPAAVVAVLAAFAGEEDQEALEAVRGFLLPERR
ncbi:MAG: protein kinase [Planctomycetes bacterium]|nr:protein kinase [Planctomycetota bacterium]